MKTLLANLILIFHFLFTIYIVLGFVYIWTGYFLNWVSIRNPIFRWSHLISMFTIIMETVAGIFCPLTEWEASLREASGENKLYPEGFITYWVHQLLYYDLPVWIFNLIYFIFFGLMVITLFLIPPYHKRLLKK